MGATVHPSLLPHAAAAPSSSQWDSLHSYHLVQDPCQVPLALGLLWVPRGVLGVCFPVQSTPDSMGAVAAPTTAVLRTLGCGVRGCRSAGRCKLCCNHTQAAFGSSSWQVLWPKICLGRAIFRVGACQQHSHAPGVLCTCPLPKPVQAASQLVAAGKKVIPCPTCQYLHCKWTKLVYLINDTTAPLQ